MILANDAVSMFVKGLAELDIVEELNPPKLECRKNRAWTHGKRIIEFLKAVNIFCWLTLSSTSLNILGTLPCLSLINLKI